MKRTLSGLLILVLAVFSGQAARADAFEDILKKGVVRIATPLDTPPMGSQNEKREPEGFDVELAGMVAKALGVKLEMQQITAGNRIPYLITNKVDIVISVMGLTPERARQVMFTSPYADTQLAVYGPKSIDVKSADQLGNYKVAATKGSTMEIALTAMNPKAQIMRTEDDATSAAAYLSGQADLFSSISLIIPDLKRLNPNKEFEVKFPIRRSPAHMAVRMGEHNLVRWLDEFIFFNMMNGEIDRLHQKWLGVKLQPLPSL
ncbi:MAG: transporter substrate-binding domain-containing protein [Alphaproteobacteria bacterium]|nr:transporter substrate-binding domain-containing protein [Alphaproteobacteria bacterium]